MEWEGAPAIQATLIDIGEQKRMQAALQAVDAQLQQSQRLEMVGQLTGGVAHDFNNLLAVIAGNAEMLGEAVAGEPKLSDFCRRVLMATKRGAELTHRLLAYSRRQALNPRQTDLNALVNDMGELLRRTLGEAVTVRIDSEDGLWECEIDPVQMENVLLNLAINARDAMANGGDLTIATRNWSITEAEVPGVEEGVEELIPGDYVVTTVTDNGEGMSDDILDKVYEPFFTTKDVGEGTGLGLSMT